MRLTGTGKHEGLRPWTKANEGQIDVVGDTGLEPVTSYMSRIAVPT